MRSPRIILLVLLSLTVIVSAVGWQHFRFVGSNTNAQTEKITVEPVATLHAEGRGNSTLKMRDGKTVMTEYNVPTELSSSLRTNQVKPLALAAGDFDGDGVDDLISGYSIENSGLLTLHRGNIESIFPNNRDADDVSAFRSDAKVFSVSDKPEFVCVGDFNNDGKQDVVTAERGGYELSFFKGDGKGSLQEAEKISLQGEVTVLTAGDLNSKDGLKDLAVGAVTDNRAEVLIFEGWNGALNNAEVETIALPRVANSLEVVSFDEDVFGDLAISTENELFIVHGRDRQLTLDEESRHETKAVISRQSFDSKIITLTSGRFSDHATTEIIILTQDGSLYIAKEKKNERNRNREREIFSTRVFSPSPLHPFTPSKIFSARVSSSRATDDLILLDREDRQLHILNKNQDAESIKVSASFDSDTEPVAALPMRLNKDGLGDIVFLSVPPALTGGSMPQDNPPAYAGGSDLRYFAPSVVMTASQAIFTVNSRGSLPDIAPGDGVCETSMTDCSLRAAIQEANASAGADEIRFNIPGPAPFNITLPLGFPDFPTIDQTTTIDGTTQQGFKGTPIVQIDALSASAGNCIAIFGAAASNSVVRGLVINKHAAGAGIAIFGVSNVKAEGNYIGIDVTGTIARGNGSGVAVNGGDGNIIGGTTAAARNVISANTGGGVGITSSSQSLTTAKVIGNYIGTNAAGTAALGNLGGSGISVGGLVSNAPFNIQIGDVSVNSRNIISGNGADGVNISGFNIASASGISITSNFIGTDVTGNIDLGNSEDGVEIVNLDILLSGIGSSAADGFNLISGNNRNGIRVAQSDGVRVINNLIGTKLNGTNFLLNNQHGILLASFTGSTEIGGSVGRKNTIAFANGFDGISITNNNESIAPEVADGNSNNVSTQKFIFSSTNDLAVDLGNNGRTPNDSGDGDTGPNRLQNFAEITIASPQFGNINLQGTLNSTPNTGFEIDFYLVRAGADGQVADFIGFVGVETGASGNAFFNETLPAQTQQGDRVFAITTNVVTNDSSESSPLVLVQLQSCSFVVQPLLFGVPAAGGDITVNVTTQAGCTWNGVSNAAFITGSGGGVGNGSVTFNVAQNTGNARAGTVTVANQTVTVNQASGCTFQINPTSFNVSAGGGNVTVNVTTGTVCNWNGVSNAAFITGGGGGTGSGSITFNVQTNNNLEPRQGTMTVAGQTVTVNQAGQQSCSFVVQPQLFGVPAAGGDITVNVTTQAGCTWNGVSNAAFITGGGNGTGSGSVNFNVGRNFTPQPRQGTMTVANQTVTVNQASDCAYNVSPTTINIAAEGGNRPVVVSTQGLCEWSATSNNPSLVTVSPQSGAGTNTVVLTIQGNNGPNPRTGTATIAGQTVTVNQEGCGYSASPSNLTFPAAISSRTFRLTTTATTCQWEASLSPAGMGLVSPTSGTGDQSFIIALTPNNGSVPRNATVTLTGGNSVSITQLTKSNNLDFDGDNKADIAKVGTGSSFIELQDAFVEINWVINNSSNGSQRVAAFGQHTDKIVPGDYNGDGKSDLAVFRPSDRTWYIARPTSQNFDAIPFGLSSDIPVQADYDGDGRTDIAVFRPSEGNWYILQSTDNQVRIVNWGLSSDKPVPADFDGDGRADIAVWRPSNGVWYIINSNNNSFTFVQWGLSSDKPLIGDFDGDFKNDISVFRPSQGNWFILRSSNNSLLSLNWGFGTDVLVPADYDGDLKTDVAVWRPSEGKWYILRSSDGGVEIRQLGQSGDVPVPSALLPQ